LSRSSRQQRDAGGKGDHHADARDFAQFGNALVVSRQEREKAGRGRHRRQRERDRTIFGGLGQRRRQIVVLVAFRAVSHAELDAEVHPEPDKQNRKGNREQVERTDHHQTYRGRDRQADEQIDEDRENDLRRMQRHPEDDQHDEHGGDSVDHRAVLHRGKLFIGDRNRAGKPYPGLELALQIKVPGCLTDGVGRGLAGFERVEVEDRLDLNERATVGIGQRLVADEFAPGKRAGTGLQHSFDGLGDQRERTRCAVKGDLPAAHPGKPGFQRSRQAPETRIARHDFQERCRGLELTGHLGHLGRGQKQQSVLFKKLPGAKPLDGIEVFGIA
jgi:hypothetical protein